MQSYLSEKTQPLFNFSVYQLCKQCNINKTINNIDLCIICYIDNKKQKCTKCNIMKIISHSGLCFSCYEKQQDIYFHN